LENLSLLLNVLPDRLCAGISGRADEIPITPERLFLPEMTEQEWSKLRPPDVIGGLSFEMIFEEILAVTGMVIFFCHFGFSL
jgi:hypothetical protein